MPEVVLRFIFMLEVAVLIGLVLGATLGVLWVDIEEWYHGRKTKS